LRRSQNDKRDNALANILETIVPRLPVHAEHVLVRAMLARGHRIDTKPNRRLHEVLRSQGVLPRQHVTFLSDGGDTVRELPAYLHPHCEHILDWFHIAMRVEQLSQTARGFYGTYDCLMTKEKHASETQARAQESQLGAEVREAPNSWILRAGRH